MFFLNLLLVNLTEVNLLDDEYVYVFRMLSYVYLNGYDEIKVNYTNLKQLELVQGYVVKYFLGFDIVEQYKNYCVISNVSGDRLDEFDSILRRFFLSLIQMSEIYKAYLEDG